MPRVHSWTKFLAMLITLLPSLAQAQDADREFCQMIASVSDGELERVGAVDSAVVTDAVAMLSRPVTAGVRYLVVVALGAPATNAELGPSAITGGEALLTDGPRVALDFEARASGMLALSFRAPPGTRYHAALYALIPPPPSEPAELGVRAGAQAVHANSGFGTGASASEVHPPDCRPVVRQPLAAPPPPPELRVEHVVVQGPLPQARVRSVVQRDRAALERCAEAYGSHDLTLQFVVGAGASIQSPSARGHRRLGDCVIHVARRWRFPTSRGRVARVELTLSFAPP